MREEPLTGGRNASEVVRAGDTVRRARDDGSDFAARLLRYLEEAGYPHAPRYLGVDERGRDILSYVPGQTSSHPAERAAGAYARGAAMLRALHDLTAGHPLASGHECVLHGDPGPFNAIFRAGMPAAFIDWTSSRPGDRLDDLGYLAWTWCVQADGSTLASQAARLRELRDGYGPVSGAPVAGATLLAAMTRGQERIVELLSPGARDPRLPAGRRAWAAEAVQWAVAGRALTRAGERAFLAALR